MRRAARFGAVLAVVVGAIASCGPSGWVCRQAGLCLPLPAINTPFLRPSGPLAESALRERVSLPPGFSIDFFVENLPHARLLRFTPTGDLLVSSRLRGGSVRLVERDQDGDGRADGVRTLIDGLDQPHGIDLLDGWLYIAETGRVIRVRFDPEARVVAGEPEVVVPELPTGGGHSTRTLRFGPDGLMYVTVGSSCNACEEDDERRAAMLRYAPDGSGYELFATGLRNSVGFAFHPETNEIYATDNGRDLLGDDFPPCELNRVVRGGFYGWPFAHGDRVPDPSYGLAAPERVEASVAPVHGFGAHTAPLGLTFYRGRMFPEEYRGALFVAQHGSWNRSRKSGYQVAALRLDPVSGEVGESGFAVGFEREGEVIGRPVDVAEGPDGALYVSDDWAGAIYRIRYGGGAEQGSR